MPQVQLQRFWYSMAVLELLARATEAWVVAAGNGRLEDWLSRIADGFSRRSPAGKPVPVAFFSCFRRAASKALCALATARCRRSRSFCWAVSSFARSARPELRHALLCATYSRSPTLSTFPPAPPLMAFRTTDTVFGHPNATNTWNGRFAAKAVASRHFSRFCVSGGRWARTAGHLIIGAGRGGCTPAPAGSAGARALH